MGRKLGTSDLHFGHTNIMEFTNRAETMKVELVQFPHKLWEQYSAKGATQFVKREMTNVHDEWLLEKLNSQIEAGDIVYHLGDFSFHKDKQLIRDIILKLKGDWVFILGNHDNESHLREACKGTRHKVVGHYHEISVNKVKACLFHFPIEEWHKIHKGAWHFHGHLHGKSGHGDYVLKEMDRRMDVGIDSHPTHGIFDLELLVSEPL